MPGQPIPYSEMIEALEKAGDPRAIPHLISCVRWIPSVPPIEAAAKAARKALKTLTGQDFGTDIGKWQEWWWENKDRLLRANNEAAPQ